MDAKLLTVLFFSLIEFGCAKPICLPKKEFTNCSIYEPAASLLKVTSASPYKITSIYCKPLFLTDIDYADESVISVSSGDSDRWMFQIVNNVRGNHLLIKPKENNISTNALIVTSDNTYHLNLVANSQKCYLSTYHMGEKHKIAKNLNSNYTVTNKTSWFGPMPNWTPSYIYNDGTHVYIEMPSAIKSMKAPLLYELDEDDELNLINYYFRDGKYIVENLFERAVLVSKAGKSEQKIVIEYHKD